MWLILYECFIRFLKLFLAPCKYSKAFIISIYNPESPTKTRIRDILKPKRSSKLFPNTIQIFDGKHYWTRLGLKLKIKWIPSWLEIKINERSFFKLYKRTRRAITAPTYTASFFPGSRFPDVLREITSGFRINKLWWLNQRFKIVQTNWFFYLDS